MQPADNHPAASGSINIKRTYLSLLPPFQLIDLLLAIDADRTNTDIHIFPPNLEDAVKHLQAARQAYPAHLYAPHYYVPHPPPPHPGASLPPSKSARPNASSVLKTNRPPPQPTPVVKEQSPPAPSTVPTPQAKQQSPQALFTSAPLTHGGTGGDHRAPEDMPSYEEMLVEALTEINDPDGTPPKLLFAWMAARYPLQSNFRPSASQALQKAFRRGRLLKSQSGKYRLNTSWEGTPTARRTSRRPQYTSLAFTPPPPHPQFWSHNVSQINETDTTVRVGQALEQPSEDIKPTIVTVQVNGETQSEEPALDSKAALRASLYTLAQQLQELVSARTQ